MNTMSKTYLLPSRSSQDGDFDTSGVKCCDWVTWLGHMTRGIQDQKYLHVVHTQPRHFRSKTMSFVITHRICP